ncbi:MAG: ABC transporter substrate-binding protein [Acidimicrobiales bacterium]|nr:ABC transporter substrate-binding protein [Acidimicrobiales bacterium]
MPGGPKAIQGEDNAVLSMGPTTVGGTANGCTSGGGTVKRAALLSTLVLALCASACGTRVPEQTQALSSGGIGDGVPNATVSAGVRQSGGRGGASDANDGKVMFGDLEVPCNGGDTSSYTATELGVTATEIRIATIADPGGPKPGLNQGVFDSMEAFVKWCNDLGGINGRKLKLDLLDAKIVEYQQRVQFACENDFALVGGIGVLDNLGAQDQVNCGLINVPAAAVNPEQTGADLTYASLPNPPHLYNVGPTNWIRERYPDVIDNAAAIYTDLSVTKMQSDRLVEAYEARGFKFTARPAAAISESNWGPIVSQMKNRGVKFMTLTSSFEEVIPLVKEMAAQNFKPLVELEANYYNQKFPDQAGSVADGVLVRLQAWPLEEADKNPAMRQYLEIMKKYKPDGVLELLGVQAFSSGLLFATAAKSLGAEVTRERLEQALRDIHTWSGGGMHAPTDPGAQRPSPCFIMMRVEGSKFVREYPREDTDPEVYHNDRQKGFACPRDEESFVELRNVDYRSMGAKRK